MKIYRSFEDAIGIPKPVITTGSFDGVHVGHKTILNRLNTIAGEIGGESVLVTFHPHPRKVLYPETTGKDLLLINSQEEKIKLLEKVGLQHLIIVEFTMEFSKISSVDYIRKILVGQLDISKVVIGFNHNFGHNREGNFEYLYELGKFYDFGVEEIPEQDIHNEFVSSTKIRKALIEGNIQRANAYLDHQYMIMGKANANIEFSGSAGLDFMEIPITEEEKLVPPPGFYAVHIESGSLYSKGMVVCLPSERRDYQSRVFLHLFEESQSMEGRNLSIFFHKKVNALTKSAELQEVKKKTVRSVELVQELIY